MPSRGGIVGHRPDSAEHAAFIVGRASVRLRQPGLWKQLLSASVAGVRSLTIEGMTDATTSGHAIARAADAALARQGSTICATA
jgi:hypothetical protein